MPNVTSRGPSNSHPWSRGRPATVCEPPFTCAKDHTRYEPLRIRANSRIRQGPHARVLEAVRGQRHGSTFGPPHDITPPPLSPAPYRDARPRHTEQASPFGRPEALQLRVPCVSRPPLRSRAARSTPVWRSKSVPQIRRGAMVYTAIAGHTGPRPRRPQYVAGLTVGNPNMLGLRGSARLRPTTLSGPAVDRPPSPGR